MHTFYQQLMYALLVFEFYSVKVRQSNSEDITFTLNQIEPHWTRLDQIGPNWTKLDHIGPHWTTLDQIGPHWTTLDKIEPHWTKLDHFVFSFCFEQL